MNTQTSIKLWRIPTSTAAIQKQLPSALQDVEQQLSHIAQRFDRITLANSLAVEDMVLTDMIAKLQLAISVFIIDTGKLHAESLSYLHTVRERYPNLEISVFQPKESELTQFLQHHEFVKIYESLHTRKACCYARKIEPLKRALAHSEAWITGQRREQSSTRTQLALEEFDTTHQLYKFNPLAKWSLQQVWAYVQQQHIPINPLYHQGIPSIGCDPCTKAIRQDEDIRAGRWWWESQSSKECGLHSS